ncbi:Aste57867_15620 [Aphanomyces stellatus]|uniref:Aste57867_15620 protein n=1 Tax=Aphanomyces stellatus TaxID=120398 RepID=A0A485L4J0_9STRA|nr:hypothetical protein As57867_015564 [Aphanomyces stellatus]VFT92418.1 Aste57867_15620 [Aphanomyces stellatus]
MYYESDDECDNDVSRTHARATVARCGCNLFETAHMTGYEHEHMWCAEAAKKLGVQTPNETCNTKWTCLWLDDDEPPRPLRVASDGNLECWSNDGKVCALGQAYCNALVGSHTQPKATVKCGCSLFASTGITGYETENHWCQDAMNALGADPPEQDCKTALRLVVVSTPQKEMLSYISFLVGAGLALVVYRRRVPSTKDERQEKTLDEFVQCTPWQCIALLCWLQIGKRNNEKNRFPLLYPVMVGYPECPCAFSIFGPAMPKFYGRGQWDPKLIFLQIVCLQCSHYLALGLLLFIFHGRTVSLDQFFSYKLHAFESTDGIQTVTAHALGGLSSALFLCFFVERAKKCLDFGLTLYFIDFLVCCFYEGFPSSWSWWVVRAISLAITVVLGEYLCSLRELEEIPMLDLFSQRRPHSPKRNATQEKHS